jgi:hypothetical protein
MSTESLFPTTATTTTTMPLSGDTETNAIMLELEKKAEIQLDKIMSPVKNANTIEKIGFVATQGPDFAANLVSIMSSGAKEFEEKTGRKMTYSEMRAMYG